MGAERFDEYQNGTDASKAFKDAHARACYDYGHRGYTGSLAEKSGFILRDEARPHTLEDAKRFADEDMEENYHDKWGPAWALKIKSDDSDAIIGYLFYGYASS